MRQGEEQVRFCAGVMSTARRCSIGIGPAHGSDGFAFAWRDPMSERIIHGPFYPIEKDALELACETLINYFNERGIDPSY